MSNNTESKEQRKKNCRIKAITMQDALKH